MMESPAQKAPADAFSDTLQLVRSVLRRSMRYWPVAAASLLLGAVAFVVTPWVHPPVYRSEVVLKIQEGLEARTVLGMRDGGESVRARNARLQARLFSRPNLSALVEQEQISPDSVAKLGVAIFIKELESQIRFSAGVGNTLLLSFEDPDPALAQRAARRLGKLLSEQVGRDASAKAAAAWKFLEDEETKLAEDLQAREAEYAKFVTEHPEFAEARTAATASRAPPTARTAGGKAAGANAALRRQADRLRRRLEQIRSPLAEPPPPPIAAEPQLTPESRDAIASAQRELQRATEELAAREAQLTKRHPDVVAGQARLSAAQDRLARIKAAARAMAVPPSPDPGMPVPPMGPETEAALEQQLKNVESAMRAAANVEAQGESESSSTSEQSIVNLETRWAALSRALKAARDRHEAMQRRLFNAILLDTAQNTGGGTQLVVAEDAYLPKLPIRLGPRRTGAVALAAVVVLGLFITVGLGYLDPRVLSECDLAHLNVAPIALIVPRLPRPKRENRKG